MNDCVPPQVPRMCHLPPGRGLGCVLCERPLPVFFPFFAMNVGFQLLFLPSHWVPLWAFPDGRCQWPLSWKGILRVEPKRVRLGLPSPPVLAAPSSLQMFLPLPWRAALWGVISRATCPTVLCPWEDPKRDFPEHKNHRLFPFPCPCSLSKSEKSVVCAPPDTLSWTIYSNFWFLLPKNYCWKLQGRQGILAKGICSAVVWVILVQVSTNCLLSIHPASLRSAYTLNVQILFSLLSLAFFTSGNLQMCSEMWAPILLSTGGRFVYCLVCKMLQLCSLTGAEVSIKAHKFISPLEFIGWYPNPTSPVW